MVVTSGSDVVVSGASVVVGRSRVVVVVRDTVVITDVGGSGATVGPGSMPSLRSVVDVVAGAGESDGSFGSSVRYMANNMPTRMMASTSADNPQ